MWMDLFRFVFSAIFSLKVTENTKPLPARLVWLFTETLSTKSDANFAGAKLKNFVAKREGRIAIFIEKTWLKS